MAEQIKKELLKKIIRNNLGSGCVWYDCYTRTKMFANVLVFSNINEVVKEMAEIALESMKLRINLSNNEEIDKFIKEVILIEIDNFLKCFQKDSRENKFMNEEIQVDCIIAAKINMGEVTEITFGTKSNGEKYTAEEVKVILRRMEFGRTTFGRFSGRSDKFTFISIIVNMEKNINSIRFTIPDIGSNEDNITFKRIERIIKTEKNRIILIPYSIHGHSVTLIIDREKFIQNMLKKEEEREECIMCFDSSYCFVNSRIYHFFGLFSRPGNGDFRSEHFSSSLYNVLVKKPINDKKLQGLEGTCTFYTEAVIKIVGFYIQENPNANLEEIRKYINEGIIVPIEDTREIIEMSVMEAIEAKKEEYYYQYKAELKIETTPPLNYQPSIMHQNHKLTKKM